MTQSSRSHNSKIETLPWWVWIAGVDLFLIVMTAVKPYMPDSIQGLFRLFSLEFEMNIATWWASMCLLTLALLFGGLYITQTGGLKTPWLALAAVFLWLSLDEISSIHERLGSIVGIVPLIAAFALFVLVSVGRLFFSSKVPKRAIVLIVITFGLFGSIPVQDYIQELSLTPYWARGIRAGIEEGLELLAAFFSFAAVIQLRSLAGTKASAAKASAAKASAMAILPDPLHLSPVSVLMSGGVALHCLVTLLVPYNTRIDIFGEPAVWYPVAAYLILAFLSLHRFWEGKSIYWLLGAGFFALNSIAAVYLTVPRPAGSGLYRLGLEPGMEFYIFYLVDLVFLAFLALTEFRDWQKSWWFVFPLLFILLMAGFFINQMLLRFLTAGIFASLMIYVFTKPLISKEARILSEKS